jgi:O-antigen/teichoic acid export membrane protein
VYAYLKRLLTTTAAYQAADIVSKFIALGLLPVYTRHITRGGYGVAELLGTLVIFVSILVRLGIGEAFVRYWYSDEDPERRAALARRAVGWLLVATTATAAVLAALAGPLSELVLVHRDATTFLIAVLGLWAFTNLELAYALLRVEERARAFLIASAVNVTLTIGLTVWLVVGEGDGARGLLLGNYAGSAVVLVGLWWTLRARLVPRRSIPSEPLRRLLAFGLPTVPADASVFALNLVDRYYLFHHQGRAVAGLYSLAVKLAGVVVFTVRAFQYAFPPLAYSVRSDAEAARLYALVTTYYVLVTGWIVAGLALLGRWVVRLFAAPEFFPAHTALPWLALGWALYGLFVVFVVIAGRAEVTTRNFPAALAGLVANVVLLLVLVPPYGIAGAGIALCGAYVVMLAAMYVFTRRLFVVAFEWGRLAVAIGVLGGVAVAGELALPTHGAAGLLSRAGAFVAVPVLLVLARFFRPEEVAGLRTLAGRARGLAPT